MTAPSPHLGVEDLIAGLDDAPMDAAAQQHLSSCPACRAEAARWKTAAEGVRVLVGSCAAPPWHSVDIFSAPGGPAGRARRRPRPVPNRPRSRHMLAICTAALALAIGAAYEIGTVTSPDTPAATSVGPSPTAGTGRHDGVSGVTGCSGLELVTGTLSGIGQDTSLDLTTAADTSIRVETDASTSVVREADGSVGDIADGDHVAVRGNRTDGTVAASAVGISPSGLDSVPIPPVQITIPLPGATGSASQAADGPGLALATGTVTNASAYGFTLVPKAGPAVAVTLSTTTPVVELLGSTVQQLQTGDTVAVAGTAGADGTVVADSVAQQGLGSASDPATAAKGGPVVEVPGGVLPVSGKRCTPSVVAVGALIGAS